ncbi:unnamed protein product [Calicophoron daubneyi]|uniref:Retinol dehydrogenase 11 n=1 Tax=Calicophoron daubneyi TaxID=300641 RepID=A0AAV2TS19_CALDB
MHDGFYGNLQLSGDMLTLSTTYLSIAFGFGLYMIMFRLFRKPVMCKCPSPVSKHVVVTGATSGIGRATAFELARRGWKITLGCRNMKAADQVKEEIIAATQNQLVEVLHLDLTEPHSINDFVRSLSCAGVDVLINNAGIMATTPRPTRDLGGVDIDTVTNYLGPFLLTYSMMPYLKRWGSEFPRIIFVSSALAHKGVAENILKPVGTDSKWDPKQAYADSKLACCFLARELHRRFGSGSDRLADVYCLFTGGMVNTNLVHELFSNYSFPTQTILRQVARILLKSPLEGCQTVVHCAVSPNVPRAHTVNSNIEVADPSGSGLVYSNCVPVKWPNATDDAQKTQQLWEETVSLLKLDELQFTQSLSPGHTSA